MNLLIEEKIATRERMTISCGYWTTLKYKSIHVYWSHSPSNMWDILNYRYFVMPAKRDHGNSTSWILQILQYYKLTHKRIIFSSVCTSCKTPKFHPSGFPNLFSTPAGAFSQFLFLSLNRPVFSEESKRNRGCCVWAEWEFKYSLSTPDVVNR